MSILVKICGLTSPEGVCAAVDGGANAVGFVFAESVRKIDPRTAARLAAEIPHGVVKEGEVRG